MRSVLRWGIKGVALSGSLVLLAILPGMLKFAFRGTNLTLQRLGQAVLYPVALSLAGVIFAELALYLFVPERIFPQLLIVGLSFLATFLFSAIIPPIRREIMSLRNLSREFRPSGQTT